MQAAKRFIKYWIKILNVLSYRFVNLSYNMLKSLDEYSQTTWASSVDRLLFSNGFGYVWNNYHVPDPKLLLHVFKEISSTVVILSIRNI